MSGLGLQWPTKLQPKVLSRLAGHGRIVIGIGVKAVIIARVVQDGLQAMIPRTSEFPTFCKGSVQTARSL